MSPAPDVAAEPDTAEARSSGVPAGLAAYLLLAFLVAKSAAPVRDADTFWHIASGRQLLRDWTFVGPDPLSPFTHGPWIRHAWLPDVGFGLLDEAGGPRLLAVALPLMTAVALTAVYVVLRQSAGRLLSAVLLGLAFLTMSGSISLRPQVISFAGAAVVTGLWVVWARCGRLPWIVVPLTWLWACCHGLWVLSPLIGFAALLGWVIDTRDVRGAARPALVVVGSALAGLVTPLGLGVVQASLQVREITPYIQEWQRDPLTSLPMCAFWTILAMAVAGWAWRRRRPTWVSVALMALALALALTAGRTVGPGGIILACTVAGAIQGALPTAREPWSRAELARTVAAAGTGVAVGALLVLAEPRAVSGYPAQPFSALASVPAGTVVCVDYESGSWLLWKHPGLIPTMDGRTELYTPGQLEAARDLADGVPGSDTAIRASSGCRFAVVHTHGGAADLLARTHPRTEVNGELSLFDLAAGNGPG